MQYALLQLETTMAGVFMEARENDFSQGSEEKEKDLLNILKESELYVELTPDEQYSLLKHVAEFYYSPSISMIAEHRNKVV
jgi:hypothetical protein